MIFCDLLSMILCLFFYGSFFFLVYVFLTVCISWIDDMILAGDVRMFLLLTWLHFLSTI